MLLDLHSHSCFSFDGATESTPDAMCARAYETGLSDLAITDHCDINGQVEGFRRFYDADAAWDAMCEAKEKWRGKVNLIRGIEMGNAPQYPAEAAAVLDRHAYDFVLASLHNLAGVPDFSALKYEKMNDVLIASLFDRALDETLGMLDFFEGRRLDALAHLTYPHRYVMLSGKTLDFKPHYPKLERLFGRMIGQGVALEVNVSGLWRTGMPDLEDGGLTLPCRELLELYRDCGGTLVTLGSDAHALSHIGDGIGRGLTLLREIGTFTVPLCRDGQTVFETI